MTSDTTPSTIPQLKLRGSTYLFDDWFDPIEAAVRERVRDFIQGMIEGELEATLLRPRYGRLPKIAATEAEAPAPSATATVSDHVHCLEAFGRVEIAMPRARLSTPDGKTTEWQSKVLPAYQRRTQTADALIAGADLRAPIRDGCAGRSEPCSGGRWARTSVSRVWRKVQTDWDGLERTLACRRTDCSADPRRHGGAGAA